MYAWVVSDDVRTGSALQKMEKNTLIIMTLRWDDIKIVTLCNNSCLWHKLQRYVRPSRWVAHKFFQTLALEPREFGDNRVTAVVGTRLWLRLAEAAMDGVPCVRAGPTGVRARFFLFFSLAPRRRFCFACSAAATTSKLVRASASASASSSSSSLLRATLYRSRRFGFVFCFGNVSYYSR